MTINIKGYNINYIDKGSGYAILLLHGWGANLKSFSRLISILKEKYRVLAIDYPGFGESDMISTSFSVDDYSSIVTSFLNKLDIKDVILVGHSYGGRIILKLNSKSDLPYTIKKNILIDAAGIKDKKNIKVKIKILIYKFFKSIYMILPLDDSKKDNLLAKLRKKFGSTDYSNAPKVLQETLIKSVNEDLTFCLKYMKETLIFWGKDDTVTPLWMAKLMESKIDNCGLVLLNGGHFSYIDDPITFERAIRSYLKIYG